MFALALGVVACSGGEAKAPNPTRSLDERRALEVIKKAVAAEGVTPDEGREEVLVSNAKPIHVDIGIQGKRYGIAYITNADAEMLPDKLRQPNKADERLRIASAGDGAIKIVLLYQENYRYDDLVGESHEQTTITAERALTRDVQDFVTHARTQKFP